MWSFSSQSSSPTPFPSSSYIASFLVIVLIGVLRWGDWSCDSNNAEMGYEVGLGLRESRLLASSGHGVGESSRNLEHTL